MKNRSLRAVDFARSQLPAGPRGLTGATGATGAAGAQGLRGPSDSWFAPDPGSVSLPAGAYALWGQAYALNQSGATFSLSCGIDGSFTGDVSNAAEDVPVFRQATVPILGSITLSAPGTILVKCDPAPAGVTVIRALTAVQVATRH